MLSNYWYGIDILRKKKLHLYWTWNILLKPPWKLSPSSSTPTLLPTDFILSINFFSPCLAQILCRPLIRRRTTSSWCTEVTGITPAVLTSGLTAWNPNRRVSSCPTCSRTERWTLSRCLKHHELFSHFSCLSLFAFEPVQLSSLEFGTQLSRSAIVCWKIR